MGGLVNPENAEKGKGFLEGREVEVLAAGWAKYDADGKWNFPSTCLWMEFQAEGLEKNPTQYWSIGKPEDFKPTPVGNAVKASKKMNEQCNLFVLATSLMNAGMDPQVVDTLDEDASQLVGCRFRMGVVLKKPTDKTGVPVVDEILETPGDPSQKAVQQVMSIISGKGGSIALKDIPKSVQSLDPDLRKLVLSKGWLESNFTVSDGVVSV